MKVRINPPNQHGREELYAVVMDDQVQDSLLEYGEALDLESELEDEYPHAIIGILPMSMLE